MVKSRVIAVMSAGMLTMLVATGMSAMVWRTPDGVAVDDRAELSLGCGNGFVGTVTNSADVVEFEDDGHGCGVVAGVDQDSRGTAVLGFRRLW